jgi:phosphate-selective porin
MVATLTSAAVAGAQSPAEPGQSAQLRLTGATFQQGGGNSEPAVRMDWDGRPTLVIGPVRLSPRAVLRAEMRRSDAPLEDESTAGLDLARRRVGFEGEIGRYADFQVEYEIDDPEPWRDVYINLSPIQQAQVRYGKFKMPFGLEENTGSFNLDFAYRSMASRALTPGRDRGFMAHGDVLDDHVRYEIGQFEHDGANAATRSAVKVTGEKTLAIRVSANPIRRLPDPVDDLTVGLSVTRSDLSGEGISSIKGQTTMGSRFLESAWNVLGERQRRGFEVRWRPGPVGIQAEHIRLTEERLGLSVEDTDLSPIEATGWYVSGALAVTGDAKEEGLAATEHPIGRGIGAIEVAVRIESLRFASGSGETPSMSPRAEVIVGNETRAVTFGVNWYLNRFFKVQMNLIKETIEDPSQGPLPSASTFWNRVLRIQFSL